MAMEKKLRSGRCMPGWNVYEMKTVTEAFQLQTHRPVGLVVLVPADHINRGSEILNRFQRLFFTNIPEMPDLIRLPDGLQQKRRQPVVGVGDDGDAERAGHLADGGGGENRPDFSRLPAG